MPFSLDPRLAADTHFAAHFPLCDVRVMNDARYPWLVAVPRLPNAVELVELSKQDADQIWLEIQALGSLIGGLPGVGKVNIGALGNIVRQLHIHIIGRHEGDPAWPGPVWGHSPPNPYSDLEAQPLINRVATLGKTL